MTGPPPSKRSDLDRGEPNLLKQVGAVGNVGDLDELGRIGRYRILRKVGEGGMGRVYEAEQDNPRRIVALKVIRAEYAGPELLKRFEHEAQALGRLHHPGIAQIYEAGSATATPGNRGRFR
jgi:serine/threonine protein kinase